MGAFRMPSLGADMEAGKLVEWLVKPGAPVKHGDILAVVETQKGAIEIEAFEDGIFERPLVEIGAVVPVGTPLAMIAGAGEAAAPEAPVAAAKAGPEVVAPPSPPVAPPPPAAPPVTTGERARVTPAARRLAEQKGVDLLSMTGTGPSGAITLADVEARAGGA
ncbi:biotin/lipoyl-containing protein, partial [Devosia sp.]|uniref:biotin/lipoyl-containing protein n=1 Tax=Devosia sp. TaxID=1871048 RepID=UPI002F114F6D